MPKLKNIFWIVFASVLLLPVNAIFAAQGPSHDAELQNPLKFNTIRQFLDAMLDAVVTIATPIVVLMIVYSGFLFVKAQGKPEELTKAKQAIMWTIIGAAIVLGAFVLSNAIGGTVDQLKSDNPKSETSINNQLFI